MACLHVVLEVLLVPQFLALQQFPVDEKAH